MGGKNKQRTKNNVRPSSSGRSADQLTAVSLEGAPLPGLFPTLVAPTIDTHLTTELQLCFKKLNKKDPITKAKALQELIDLIPQSKVDDIVAALPTWTHFYKILTVDPDRKVRELTQWCHGCVAAASGRRLAPQLRALLAWWLAAQHDDHAPAAARAAASLQNTFPDNKLPEVLEFCKEELTSHILDILVKNGDSAYVRKSESAEEAAAARARAAAGALGALRTCAARAPALLAPLARRLLRAPPFWRLAASADDTLRASWYAGVSSMLERAPGAFAPEHVARLLRGVTGARETAPRAAAQLWAAMLALMHHVPNWHEHLEKKELFCKRVLEVLESGGWGDARHLSSLLLPLLASLPEELLTEDFYKCFFDALLAGLEKKSVSNSRSEVWAWSRSIEECVRYVSAHKEQAAGSALVARVVRQWTALALTAPRVLLQPTASALGSVARHWRRNPLLARAAWHAVGAALAAHLPAPAAPAADVSHAILNHTALLRALKNPSINQIKSVRFDDTSSKTSSVPTVSKESSVPASSKESSSPDSSKPSMPDSPEPDSLASIPSIPQSPEPESLLEREEYLHRLTEIVISMTGKYLELCRDEGISDAVITPLVPLLQDFGSLELFEGISKRMCVTSPLELYNSLFKTWLGSDAMRCKALVDLTFVMIEYLREDEQDVVLKSLDSMPPLVAEWALGECGGSRAAGARRWARGGTAAHTLRGLAKKALEGNSAAARLLVHCFRAGGHDDPMLSSTAVDEVVKVIVEAIEEEREGAAALAAQLAAAAPPPDPLLLALATLAVDFTGNEEDSPMSNRCVSAVRAAWSDALRDLAGGRLRDGEEGRLRDGEEGRLRDEERLLRLYASVATYIHRKLGLLSDNGDSASSEESAELNIPYIEHVTSLCVHMLAAPPRAAPLPQLTRLALDVPAAPPAVEALALTYDIVEGNLTCPFADNDVSEAVINDALGEPSKRDVVLYLTKIIFEALFVEMVVRNVDKEVCDEILKQKYFKMEFCNILYGYMVVCSLHKAYDYWSHYEIIERGKSQLDSSIDKIISETSLEVRSLILKQLTEEAVTKGYYWAYATKYFSDKVKSVNSESEEVTHGAAEEASEVTDEKSDFSKELESFSDHVTGSGYFHSLQAAGAAAGGVCARALLAAHPRLAPPPRGAAPLADLVHQRPDLMLYDADLLSSPWSHVVAVTSIVDCLRHEVTSQGWVMPAHVWDAATLATASLLQTLNKNVQHLGDTKIAALAVSCVRLLGCIEAFAREVRRGRGPAVGLAPHVARLPHEWADVFLPDIANHLYAIVVHVLESSSTTAVRSTHISVIKHLQRAIGVVKFPYPATPQAVPLARAVGAASRALGLPTPPPYKYFAAALLGELLEPCVLHDAGALAAWSESCGDAAAPPALSLQWHAAPLRDMLLALDAATHHIRAGEETCTLEEGSEVHSVGVGLLLLADLLYRQGRLARGDLPHHYTQAYREGECWERVLRVALRLLPRGALEAGGAAPPADWFTRAGRAVPPLACRAVFAAVAGAGAAARAARAAAAPRAAAAIDRLVERCITPHVVREEFAALQKKAAEMEDTEIRVNPSTYEAWCKLSLDDKNMELYLRLARSHPLAPPTLTAPNCPTSNTHWLMLYLTYQNGTVVNAIKMWTGSITAKVERSTQCYICYCRLHPSSGKLPAVTCHTCRNKFHNVCLRKWFSSSGKSHCPLCRTKF